MFETKNINYKEAVRDPSRTWKISLDILTDNQEKIKLDNDDVVLSSFTFEEASTCSDNIEIGSVFANNISFSLQNTDGKFNDINLQYAQVRPTVSLLTDAETNEWEDVPLGTFYVTEVGRKMSTIPIKAMDGMYKLNRLLGDIRDEPNAPPFSTEGLTLHNVLSIILNYWGWSMTDAVADELRGITARLPELADEKLTCRDFVSYTAALLGKSARFGRDGRLEFFGYSDNVYETTPETRTELVLSDLELEVTGVAVINAGDERYEAEGSTDIVVDKYVIVVGKNPLLFNDDMTSLALSNAADALLGQRYTPYSCGIIGDPAIQCGDRIRHIIPDKDGAENRIIESLIMSHRFKFRGSGQLEAKGKPPEENRQLTATAKKIIEIEKKAAKDLNDGLDGMQRAILNATQAITGQSGGYVVLDPPENPEQILIMDKPDKEEAENVWRWNSAGLAHSSKGYDGPYTTAIMMDGRIVADFIKTGSLSADLIKTGTINADLIKAGKIKADYIDATNLRAERLSNLSDQSMHGIVGKGPHTLDGTGLFLVQSGYPASSEVFFKVWPVGGSVVLDSNSRPMGIRANGFSLSSGGSTALNGNSLSLSGNGGTLDIGSNRISLYGNGGNLDINSTGVQLNKNGGYFHVNSDGSAVTIVSKKWINLQPTSGTVVYGDLHVYGTIHNSSDKRLKRNIQKRKAPTLKLIKGINLYSYDWKESGAHEKCGFVAQQMDEVIPEIVHYDEDRDRYSINQIGLIPYLTKAIQEQQSVIENQNERIVALEKTVQQLAEAN